MRYATESVRINAQQNERKGARETAVFFVRLSTSHFSGKHPFETMCGQQPLLADFQTPQQIEILLGIDPLHVIQQPASPTNHPQEPTPTGVVLRVQFQMVGHLGDARGEQRNLDLRGARIIRSAAKITLQLLFPLFRKLHDGSRGAPLPVRPRDFSLWCAAYPAADATGFLPKLTPTPSYFAAAILPLNLKLLTTYDNFRCLNVSV